MNEGRVRKIDSKTGVRAGLAVAALTMLLLALIVSRLVIVWCPGGANCETNAQIFFWIGVILSAAIASQLGFAVKALVERRSARDRTR